MQMLHLLQCLVRVPTWNSHTEQKNNVGWVWEGVSEIFRALSLGFESGHTWFEVFITRKAKVTVVIESEVEKKTKINLMIAESEEVRIRRVVVMVSKM